MMQNAPHALICISTLRYLRIDVCRSRLCDVGIPISSGFAKSWKETPRLWSHLSPAKRLNDNYRSVRYGGGVIGRKIGTMSIALARAGRIMIISRPLSQDDGIFEEDFIEERRKGLEGFINKVAGHPLAQNERCLHMFLQEPIIDKNYVPGKIRNT